ncbi:hypothetical protein SDC9_202273 [bioreactor metagenome]|uniref:Helix-turn-helix domain-containing protein n=1 Tax=bioreactor metagenome TaxID=1076179 RepID=A0A645IUS6_9ZZZZ
MLSVREYAKKSGLSYERVKDKCNNGELNHEITPGGHIQIYPAELERILSPNGYVPIDEYKKVCKELERAKRILEKIREEIE